MFYVEMSETRKIRTFV